MSAATPPPTPASTAQLKALGEQVRAQRKALRVSATAAAEAAGISRVTLHRIEKGEPSVSAGAWGNALAALGLIVQAHPVNDNAAAEPADRTGWIPARIRLGDYPQLKALAWHVQGVDALAPAEALAIYERNARHLDAQAMTPNEQALLDALRVAFQPEHNARAPGV